MVAIISQIVSLLICAAMTMLYPRDSSELARVRSQLSEFIDLICDYVPDRTAVGYQENLDVRVLFTIQEIPVRGYQ